jgi:uncharacterized protein YndB with AHSA1/START domain
VIRVAIVCLGLCFAALPARADVVDAAPGGFSIRIVVTVAAPATQAYRAAVERVGSWWSPDHTFSGNAANLSIDASPGGCWCEKLASGGGVRHLTVVYADPGKLIRFSGGLGPLQDMAVSGAMQWAFKEADGRTTIEVTYKVGGYAPGGLEPLAKAVDGVLTLQIQRLKALVDTGKPLG